MVSLLANLRARQPGASIRHIAWWYVAQAFSFVWMAGCYRHRAWGMNNLPRTGPVLMLSNHQSYLDPMAVGVSTYYRQFYAMARSTLFKNRFFGWLITSINAIPIDQGQSDVAAMRQAIAVLNSNNALLIFPEGTRTTDGTTKAFSSGTMLLIKRAKPVVVPVAIEGAYAAWPKGRAVPKLTGRVGVQFGQPISAEEILAMGNKAGLEYIRQRIETMRLEIAQRIDLTGP